MMMMLMRMMLTNLSLQWTAHVKLCVRFPVITFTNYHNMDYDDGEDDGDDEE